MANSYVPVSRVPRIASAMGLALAISAGLAGAQAPTKLVPAIRNFEWVNPNDRPDTTTTEARIAALPKLLSAAGLYSNIGNKATRAIVDTSVVPFQVNSALWSDASHKERFISLLPGTNIIPTDTTNYTFPDGAVLIKNFLIDTVYGDNSGNSRIFVETRFMVYQSSGAGKGWSGISYRWRRDQSDAELVHPDSGLDFIHNVRHNGQLKGKRWRYPSTKNCNSCHRGEELNKTDFRGSLGFITPQLNRVINGTNQLQSLVMRGILSTNPVAGKPTAHRWYALNEDSVSLEKRVRSYFASNCSHCHNPKVSLTGADHNFNYFNPSQRINFQPDTSNNNIDPLGGWLNKPSASGGGFGYLIQSGYPDSLALLNKMKTRTDWHLDPNDGDPAQMPPLATAQPDSAAVKLIEQWVCTLKSGTPCAKIPWLPEETFWDSATTVSLRLHGKFQNPAFNPSMRQGRLSIPAHIAAGKVELRDYRGRKVELVQEGKGEYRIPSTLTPGIYFLAVGQYRASLNYIP